MTFLRITADYRKKERKNLNESIYELTCRGGGRRGTPEITIGGPVTHAAPAAQRGAGGQRPRRHQPGPGRQPASAVARILLRLRVGHKLRLTFALWMTTAGRNLMTPALVANGANEFYLMGIFVRNDAGMHPPAHT